MRGASPVYSRLDGMIDKRFNKSIYRKLYSALAYIS